MTREEALEVIKSHPFLFASFPDDVIEALDVLIKQEPILDKIRTEIETKYGQCSICEYDSDYGLGWYQVGDIADILQIIDDCKPESEG